MTGDDIINQMMGVVDLDKNPYWCVKCSGQVETIPVKTALQDYRKMFYCPFKTCERFGMLTVVVKKVR